MAQVSAPGGEGPASSLSAKQFEDCLAIAERYLETHQSIRNRDMRKETRISYDQAIHFFNHAIRMKRLVRQGNGGGTSYVLPKRQGKERTHK